LSGLFKWALQKRKVTVNPCIGVWHPGAPPARERVLTEAEIRWLWKASDEIGSPFGAVFQLLLLTGARLAEVTGMRHGELSENGAIWTIPGERTKNHRTHLVPLPPLACEIIADIPRIESPAGFVFTTAGKRPVSGFSKAKPQLDREMLKQARSEAKDAGRDPTKITVADFRLHDLRRTAATGMADLGVQPHIIEAVLNHVSGHKAGVAGIYNRAVYAAEKQAALERWAAHVEGIVSGRPTKVVRMRRDAS
jgi:integrase